MNETRDEKDAFGRCVGIIGLDEREMVKPLKKLRHRIEKELSKKDYRGTICAWRLNKDEVMSVITYAGGNPAKPYIVTLTYDEEYFPNRISVTFSPGAWDGRYPPEVSQMVILTGIQAFRGGWRAQSARPVSLSETFFLSKKEVKSEKSS